jgi:hypothetical protein
MILLDIFCRFFVLFIVVGFTVFPSNLSTSIHRFYPTYPLFYV